MPTSDPLTGSSEDQMVAGVCAGIARWLGWDPTADRIAYVVLSLLSAGFPGAFVYVILWFVMPMDRG